MAFTGVVATVVDRRSNRSNKHPVWEKTVTFTIDSNDGSAKLTKAVSVNGILQKIVAVSGTAAGITGTFTLSIDDNSDNEIFTAATPVTPAEGAVSTFNVNEPVSGDIDVGINPNDDPTSGSWTITITLRGI